MDPKDEQTKKAAPAMATPAPAAIAPASTTPPAPTAGDPGQSSILTRIARAIDRALASEPKRTGWELTAFMILDACGGQGLITSPSGLEKLRAWQQQHDRATSILNSHTHEAAYEAWQKHSATLGPAIQSETLHEQDGWSREDWEQDYQQKINAASADLQRICKESVTRCQAISERFVAAATRFTDRRQDSERNSHDHFGIPYTPSAIVLSFRKAIQVAEKRTEYSPYGNWSPRQMLPYINF
jgi:hypothetical protein